MIQNNSHRKTGMLVLVFFVAVRKSFLSRKGDEILSWIPKYQPRFKTELLYFLSLVKMNKYWRNCYKTCSPESFNMTCTLRGETIFNNTKPRYVHVKTL